jgi:thiol-disulfide isomerase/thioredoxin
MNKKVTFLLVTAFLLACNALVPPTSTPTPQDRIPSHTEAVLQPTDTREAAATSDPESASAGFKTVRLHLEDGDLQTLLPQEAKKAIELGLMPVLEFDASWCPPCQAIQQGLESENELLLKAYDGTYIIKLDVDEWGWGDSDLHDFEFDGIPVYFKLDAQGNPTGEVIDGNAWGDNIPENIAPPMDEFFHGE